MARRHLHLLLHGHQHINDEDGQPTGAWQTASLALARNGVSAKM
jgi:hypothetical protein